MYEITLTLEPNPIESSSLNSTLHSQRIGAKGTKKKFVENLGLRFSVFRTSLAFAFALQIPNSITAAAESGEFVLFDLVVSISTFVRPCSL